MLVLKEALEHQNLLASRQTSPLSSNAGLPSHECNRLGTERMQ